MALNIEVEVLERMAFFANVERGKLKLIAFAGQRIECRRGETLFRQDEPPDSVYVILDGTADIYREVENGGRILLAKVGQGETVGEIGVMCNRPRTATVVAGDDLVVLRLEADAFMEFVRELPQLSLAIIHELSRRLEVSNKALAEAMRGR